MNTFANAVDTHLDEAMTVTENGMATRKVTANKVLDLFGKIGSSRGTPLVADFAAAMADNSDLALRTLLWARDVRGGAGERGQFRALLADLEKRDPRSAALLMPKIPLVGRWDDLFVYQDATNRANALEMYADALRDGNGLAFKWAPREKSAKRAIAYELRTVLGMGAKQYRKFLAAGTDVVESKMAAKDWDNINFSHVPSLASARYQKAFGRNASEAYSAYINELSKPVEERDPKVKVNAGAVYPYDVIRSIGRGNAAVADAQWDALPNYVGNAKILPMVDVSGSMTYGPGNGPEPIEVAVSLGLYLSGKNTSSFKDLFLTFTGQPEFVKVEGTLTERVRQMKRANWQMNTNVEAAFNEILRVAVKGNVSQDDMPDALLILSDMQFDAAQRSYYGKSGGEWNPTAVQLATDMFEAAGYKLPKLVFWDLNAGYGDNAPVRFDENGTALVSGFSPAIMKSVLSVDLEEFTPMNVMLDAIMNARYAVS